MDKEKRDRLTLRVLLDRRVGLEREARDLKEKIARVKRDRTELHDEAAALDAILGGRREPSAPVPSVTAATATAKPAASAPRGRRRSKGSRREQLLPGMRKAFRGRTFTTENVTDLVRAAEGIPAKKAYYAAWSLCRDLAADGVIASVSKEGRRRTFRFVET